MQKLLLAGVALTALAAAAPAIAADIPAPVYKAAPMPTVLPANWTGFYLGGHIGGGWGSKELSAFDGKDLVFDNVAQANVNGFLGGVQGGYNYQMGWVVVGVEGDFSWADIKGTSPFGSNFCCGNFTAKTDWTATVTGRIGGTVDHALLYVKGGAAWAHDKYSAFFDDEFGSETRFGYVVGGGIEYAFTRNWSGKVEYNYMDFGTKDLNFCGGGYCDPFRVFQRLHEVKVGLNYRFDWLR